MIVVFHDVCGEDDYSSWLRVPFSRFKRQIGQLGDIGDFIDPDELLQPSALRRNRLSIVITFDDGYKNVADLAAPYLDEQRIPATYFVSTGPLLSRMPFFADIVVTPIQVLQLRELDLRDFGLGVFRFRERSIDRRWDDIQRLLVALKSVGNEDHPTVGAVAAWMREKYSSVLSDYLPAYQPITRAQVSSIARSQFGRIGSHGHAHRIMPRLDDEELAESLVLSKRILGDICGVPITELAYPNGDYDLRVQTAVRDSGYVRAFSATEGLVQGPVDTLALPRLSVGAYDTPKLIRWNVLRLLVKARFAGGYRQESTL